MIDKFWCVLMPHRVYKNMKIYVISWYYLCKLSDYKHSNAGLTAQNLLPADIIYIYSTIWCDIMICNSHIKNGRQTPA